MLIRLKDRSDSVHSVTEETSTGAEPMVLGTTSKGSMSRKRSSVKRPAPVDEDSEEAEPQIKKQKTVTIVEPAATKKGAAPKKTAAKIARERATAAKKRTKRTAGVQPKLRREEVPNNNFMLREMVWSPWQLAVNAKGPRNPPQRQLWKPFPGGSNVIYNARPFGYDTDDATVYELAVQVKIRSRKYPVFYTTSDGFETNGTGKDWTERLLTREAKAEVNQVVKKGCKVFLRKEKVTKKVKVAATMVDGLHEMRSLINSVYDYPWCSSKDNSSRDVSKVGVQISTGSL